MYNLSKIMKRAWQLFRSCKSTFSACLRRAWREAKEMAFVLKHASRLINGRHEFGFSLPEGRLYVSFGYISENKIGWNVTGDTYNYRQELREAGFSWNRAYCAWGTNNGNVVYNFLTAVAR